MKALTGIVASLTFVAGMSVANADPVNLNENQMDDVTAGYIFLLPRNTAVAGASALALGFNTSTATYTKTATLQGFGSYSSSGSRSCSGLFC